MSTTVEPGSVLRDDARLAELVEQYGTPLYVYDGDRIVDRFRALHDAFAGYPGGIRIHYALKANTNLAIVQLLLRAGAHPECISGGEVELARRLGARPEDILLTSSSKSPQELRDAIRSGVLLNIDSLDELRQVGALAETLQTRVRVSFRANPDVDPQTHRHIATGHKLTKFGLLLEDAHVIEGFRVARDHEWLDPVGIQAHIGSQILTMEPFRRNARLLSDAYTEILDQLGVRLRFIDLGGGIGIRYRPDDRELDPTELAGEVIEILQASLPKGDLPELWLEPARTFVGGSGVLLTRVHSVKHTPFRNFVNVDTGFNQFLRPLLYEAYHHARILGRDAHDVDGDAVATYDIAGNICETGDILGEDRRLPSPTAGDVVVFEGAGAYGYSLASEYNSFPLPAEVLLRGDRTDLIRRRGTLDDLLRAQRWPEDLGERPSGVAGE